jgi:membrane protease YdiL (CAAX protease family)
MSNTPIKSWIETVKPVAAWILIVAILIQCAWSSFAHFVLFPAGILQSLSNYTGHILHPTFTVNVLLSICMGFLLCYIGGLRAKDFAIFHKQILPAVGFTLLAWAIIQLSPLLSGDALVVDPIWSEQGELMHRFSRFFIGQLFGNALYEELIYRALLISQFTILFRKKCSTTKALIFAVICSQLVFALLHIPHRIVSGIPFDQMIVPVANLFIAGLLFSALFFLSKNIFIPVGVHALANKSPNIFEQCENQFGVISIILIFLAILFWKRICRKIDKQPEFR